MIASNEARLSTPLALIMAAACGMTVANLYYNQPLLNLMAHDLGVHAAAIGAVPLLTQLGYALAMLILVPLGDVLERRGYVLWMSLAASVSLLASGLSRSVAALSATSLLVGFTSVGPQLLLPFATFLSHPRQRGRVIGIIMSGLFIGILGGRVVAGQVGEYFGWRTMYFAAAVAMLALATILRVVLPPAPSQARMRYRELLASIVALIADYRVLREATTTGACLFAAFSAFWATLVFFLADAYGYGSGAAGAFGLAGVAGALAAPLAGRFSDRGSPRQGVRVGVVAALAAFALTAVLGRNLYGLIAGVILMDFGVQAAMVSNQARIFALKPDAPSRLNTVYMVAYFGGGAFGSGAGSVAWAMWHWNGVCAFSAAILALALGLLLRPDPALIPPPVARR